MATASKGLKKVFHIWDFFFFSFQLRKVNAVDIINTMDLCIQKPTLPLWKIYRKSGVGGWVDLSMDSST